VTDANALHVTVNDLLENPNRAHRMGQNARRVFDANKGAVARTMAIITGRFVTGPHTPNGTTTNLPHGM
jgi:3-deoxy-D-manno-octulosonic-acid transferase